MAAGVAEPAADGVEATAAEAPNVKPGVSAVASGLGADAAPKLREVYKRYKFRVSFPKLACIFERLHLKPLSSLL